MKLIVIRHGQTDGNIQNLVQGAGLDLPLNDVGRQQAEDAAEKLKEYNLSVIFSSRMIRAKQTAEIIASKLGCPTEVADGMEEVHFGEAEGMPSDDAHQKYADVFSVLNDPENEERFDVRIPGGESVNDSIQRGVNALKAIVDAHRYPAVAVVTHGALMYNLSYYFFGEPQRFHNCEFFELEF